MGDEARVSLSAGKLRLELCPSVGGCISAFEWTDGVQSRPIMRHGHEPLEKSLDAPCFPLVPYVNRIRGGEFHFRGKVIRLAPNMAGDPSPLHGQGWLHPWTVEEADARRAVITYRHEPGEWPWAYEARQDFSLDDGGFAVTLSCRNLGPGPMPCGLGEHPYFPCGPQTRIDTKVAHVWTVDRDVLPVDKVPAEGRYDLRDRLACGQDLDNGFDEWDGIARLTDPDWPYEITVSSRDAHFFQLYSPSSGGIFVAEPVTHTNAALNEPAEKWASLGIRVLEEDEAMSLTMRTGVAAR